MSSGLLIKNIYLDKLEIADLSDVVKSTVEDIQGVKEHILTHMAAYPRDFRDEFNNDWTWENHVQNELNQIWDDLQNDVILNYLASVACESPSKVEEI